MVDMVHSSSAGAGANRRVLIAAPVGLSFSPMMVAFAAVSLASGASSASGAAAVNPVSFATTSGVTNALARDEDVQPSLAERMAEIKRRTGATWQLLANFFAVSRRTIHTWADGGAISAENFERVQELLEQIRLLKELRPFQVRKALLSGAERPRDVAQAEPAILISDPTPFRHNLEVTRTGRTKIKAT